MKLLEVEGKQLFRRAGIRIPHAVLIQSSKDFKKIFAPSIIKAQVLSGKRGKSGLIKKAKTRAEAVMLTKQFLKKNGVFSVLVEHIAPIQKEYYLSLMIDGITKDVIVIFSARGGMDIEDVAKKYPKAIFKFPLSKPQLPIPEKKEIFKLIKKLYLLMKSSDAELIELNPLAITTSGIIALDSKVVIDSKSLYRHPEFQLLEHRELTGRELEAAHVGLHYVDLDGNVGVIGDGAGLVMAALDVLHHFKLKPANFLDVGGGAGEERMFHALQILTQKKLKCIFINIFGGITLCDEIARAIVAAKKKLKMKVPLVVRMSGTNVEEAQRILETAQLHAVSSMAEGIKKVREICR